MTDNIQWHAALALALKLTPRERIRLIEQIAASVERDIDNTPSAGEASPESWGKALVRFLETLDSVEMAHPEIEDPVEWVKQSRREQELQRGLVWGDPE